MEINFGRITILVNDYDESFAFYEKALNCKKFFDLTINGKRYLHVGFNSTDKSGIWFVKADTEEQKQRVGNQIPGIPLLVIYTDSLEEFYTHHINENVNIISEPVEIEDSRSYHFLDLYGNEIVLVQMNSEVSGNS